MEIRIGIEIMEMNKVKKVTFDIDALESEYFDIAWRASMGFILRLSMFSFTRSLNASCEIQCTMVFD